MSKRRVVITGLGVVTSLGETVDEMWDNVSAPARAASRPITRFDFSKYPVRFGGECTNFDITQYQPLESLHRRQAAAQAAGPLRPVRHRRFRQRRARTRHGFHKEDRDRCGVIIGSGIGGIETLEEQNKILIDPRRRPGQPVHGSRA